MNINSLFGSVGTTATSNVNSVTTTSTTSASSIPPATAAASAAISTPGQFFSQMQSLSQSNPTEFKAVASQVATTFQNAASQATGQQAQFLTNLANQFSQASQTGTMPTPGAASGTQAASALQGASGVMPMHHHHHHGGGGGGMQSSSVAQAFQSAMDALTQATSSTATAATSTSVFSTSTSSNGTTT